MAAERELEKVLRELEFRMAVTKAMLSTLDLDYVLYVLLSGATSRDGIGLNRAFLFLDDDQGREMKVNLALGPQSGEEAQRIWAEIEQHQVNFPDLLPRYEAFRRDTASQALTRELASFALPLHRLDTMTLRPCDLVDGTEVHLSSVLASCLVSKQPFWTNTLLVRQEIGGSSGAVVELQNVAAVPLVVESRPIGVVLADNYFTRQPVGVEVVRRLEAVGNLAALAIDRARLHARTVAMAEVDGLTGVYNRRHYAAALDRAIVAASRSGQTLSIILFDLDRFKRVNDRHGHLVGDELLKDVARILDGQVRGADMVARYGGEEFVILLKNTGQEAAVRVADKLRGRIKRGTLAGGRVKGMTLSGGVASTRGGETAEQLFERADVALYAAKQQGRDRVVLAQAQPEDPACTSL